MLSRRALLAGAGLGLGAAMLRELLAAENRPAAAPRDRAAGALGAPHFPPRAKRVVCLFQSGGPSQIDLFDPKPRLRELHGQDLPESIRQGQRLTTMTAEQARKPVTASLFRFAKRGQSGLELSELLPHTARVADDICLLRALHTEAINHDPALTFFQTGSEQPGRPSLGAWLAYGLGSETANLPAFVVLVSGGQPGDQPLFGRLWGAGFLPSQHQGVKFRPGAAPVLYLNDPPGVSRAARGRLLNAITELNHLRHAEHGDPETLARVAAYERAFRMQTAMPELADLASEPDHVFALYGSDARAPGSFAANCLLARRLLERGARCVQLFHRGWDHHEHTPAGLRLKCRQTDQASAALVLDLKQRGLLDDTLVIWMGEFGRTVYCQGELAADDYGRDHHPRCFSGWLAGGGARAGRTHGVTDEFSYNIVAGGVHVHDLQATVLHCLGLDHERFTYRHEGRDHRLTDVAGRVVSEILA